MPICSKANITLSTWSVHVILPAMDVRKKAGPVVFPLHDLHCQPLIHLRQESISQFMKPIWLQARLTVSFLVYKWRRCFLKRSWPLLHDNQAVRQACLKLNIDENTCRGYLQHLEFLALKEDKRNLQRNAIPADICWESIENVERLTNKQLKLYLRKEGLGARWCPETKHN